MEDQINKLTKTHNIKFEDLTDIDLGYSIEFAEKIVGNEGFNPCVPKNDGKAIYQGRMFSVNGKSFQEILNKVIKQLVINKK